MLVLNYDEIENSRLTFWEEFLSLMDKKDVRKIGPHNGGVEKTDPFVTFKDGSEQILSLIENYLTDDNSVALDVRRAIFLDTIKKAETIGVFSLLENDPLLFNHEQSESFKTYVNSKKILQECIVELKKESRRSVEFNMNGFFIQLKMEKLQQNISDYENGNKQYALLDPLKYLTAVIAGVLEHSHKECLRCHRGETSPPAIEKIVDTVSVETSIQPRIEQRRDLMDQIDREIQNHNQRYMNHIMHVYGKKR